MVSIDLTGRAGLSEREKENKLSFESPKHKENHVYKQRDRSGDCVLNLCRPLLCLGLRAIGCC